MDDRVIDILAALCVAAVAAVVAWFLAQYVFGVSSRDIRISALTGAAIFALLMAPMWFGKKFK
jgi:predicted transcriptional regulator